MLQLTCCWSSSGGADEDDATSCALLVPIREIARQLGRMRPGVGVRVVVVAAAGVYSPGNGTKGWRLLSVGRQQEFGGEGRGGEGGVHPIEREEDQE